MESRTVSVIRVAQHTTARRISPDSSPKTEQWRLFIKCLWFAIFRDFSRKLNATWKRSEHTATRLVESVYVSKLTKRGETRPWGHATRFHPNGCCARYLQHGPCECLPVLVWTARRHAKIKLAEVHWTTAIRHHSPCCFWSSNPGVTCDCLRKWRLALRFLSARLPRGFPRWMVWLGNLSLTPRFLFWVFYAW